MLHSLHVRNLALIEHAELRLGAGLNVISGGTGGGKSLLVTALKLLRGERAQASLVRSGAAELQVDGEFHLGGGGERSRAVTECLESAGIDLGSDELLLGRSRAFGAVWLA